MSNKKYVATITVFDWNIFEYFLIVLAFLSAILFGLWLNAKLTAVIITALITGLLAMTAFVLLIIAI